MNCGDRRSGNKKQICGTLNLRNNLTSSFRGKGKGDLYSGLFSKTPSGRIKRIRVHVPTLVCTCLRVKQNRKNGGRNKDLSSCRGRRCLLTKVDDSETKLIYNLGLTTLRRRALRQYRRVDSGSVWNLFSERWGHFSDYPLYISSTADPRKRI